ncbi:MAG: carbohydrate porin [Deltaproteobacteria bacterium]|nr:carbohydrate porin [Deltaproteobacteria bacterium]
MTLRSISLGLAISIVLAIPLSAPLAAEPEEGDASLFPVPDYSGDWIERKRLLGDPGGYRSSAAEHGVQLEVDFVQTGQGVADGGVDDEAEYTGSFDYVLKIDVEKAGGWPGAFVLIRGETLFGDDVNGRSGSLMANNTDALFPIPGEEKTTLTDVQLIQFLHPKAGIALGKLNTLDGDLNAFAHGRGTDQFMNLSFVANPATLRTVPYSALGFALILLPIDNLIVQFSVLDAEGVANKDGFDTVFEDGTVFALEARLGTHFFDLPGHMLLGATISDRKFSTLDQDPRLVLGGILGLGFEPKRSDNSWSVYSNFDQYLWKPDTDSDRGVGVFGRLGFADESTSLLAWFVSIGVSGIGLIPGRDGDHFGIGYSVVGASDKISSRIDLEDAHIAELYYDIEVTGWLHVTPDIQIVDSSFANVDTAVVLGVRSKIEF